MSTSLPTLVVGGGIGGLSTALSIARTGRPVHVLERADRFSEIGAGLQFGPNASRALDALGVYDDVLALAVRPSRAVLMNALTGRPHTTLDLGPSFRARYGYPYLVLHRSDLLDVLVKHCRSHSLITLETRRSVVSAEIGPEQATVTCADGTTYTTDALIGADGLHSVLRPYVVDDAVIFRNYAAYRGTIPIEQLDHAVAGDEVLLWIGPGIHLIQYPVRRGELYNQVAVFRSDRYVAGHAEPDGWGGPDELDTAFAPACTTVRDGVARINRDRYWVMSDRDPCATWITGRLVLTGDAAHPMLQYLGQGACQALEDAVELGHHLQVHGTDVATAYRGFERARLPRAARCQTSARPWGELWHTTDPITVAVRDRLFAARAFDDYTEFDWLYAPAEPGTAAPQLCAPPRTASVR